MIEVILETECPNETEAIIRRAASGALSAQGAKGDISVMVIDDNGIRAMNRDYRSVDRPTDVLSFPALDEIGPFTYENYPFEFGRFLGRYCNID